MHSQKIKLKTLIKDSGLFSGYSFRGKVLHDSEGTHRVIQLKDFQDNYSSIGQNCVLVDGGKIKPKYLLEDGDILFISKGSNNFSVVYEKKDNVPTISSSSTFVIRLNKNVALPEYVSWYMNQNIVQSYLKQNLMGTYIQNINRPTVEEIPIALPNLETQKRIAKLSDLHNKEQKMLSEIKELRSVLIQQQLLNSI